MVLFEDAEARGWVVVEPTAKVRALVGDATRADIDNRPSDDVRARECDQCHEWKRPAWRFAAICIACWAQDFNAACRQRKKQVFDALRAAGCQS
jgi:hypothetical protein